MARLVLEPNEVRAGDLLVMTARVSWFVLSVEPYRGPLPELRGAAVVVCREGPITLEGPQEVLRGR